MSEISTRIEGRAGRITLTRPKALNALSYTMCLAIEEALDAWRDADIDLILLDAEGEKAFCAGGDIAEIYQTGRAGDHSYGQKFWRDEYRMNAKMCRFPKPVVALMQGFTMGGGIGIAGHGSHRVVGDSSRLSMPECGIGLVPDVGGSLILARAPGRIGEFLGLTGYRMAAGDALFAGFADYYIPEAAWPELTATLIATGDLGAIDRAAQPAPESALAEAQSQIDQIFAGADLGDIFRAQPEAPSPLLAKGFAAMEGSSPLSMAATLEIIHRVRGPDEIGYALGQEYRFTFRATEHSDFLEGVRAAIIDKDRQPRWRHSSWRELPASEVLAMTLPLGDNALTEV